MIPNCTCLYCPPYVGIPNAEAAKIIDVPPRIVPEKPPGMTLAEAIESLRQGKRVTSAKCQPWEYVVLDADGVIRNQDNEPTAIGANRVEKEPARKWHLYVGPVSDQTAPKTEDLTTVEALAALADGKRVRQTYPSQESIWWLRDGFFRSSAGHCSENLAFTAHDLMQGRYRLEP